MGSLIIAHNALDIFSIKLYFQGTNMMSMEPEDFFFGSFEFNVLEDFLQTYNFTSRSSVAYQNIRINVLSNHGAGYTCIYR